MVSSQIGQAKRDVTVTRALSPATGAGSFVECNSGDLARRRDLNDVTGERTHSPATGAGGFIERDDGDLARRRDSNGAT